MGSGIAQVLATAGIDVTLVDVDAARLQQAGDAIDASLTRVARQQSLDPAAVQAIRARIRFTTVLDASAGPDLLVEAVVEDLATKQRVLERGAEVLPDTALVSNTSSISITALAGAVGGPERVAGMHFFNPVPVMPLVEVVRGQPPPSPPSVRWSPSPSAWARPWWSKTTPASSPTASCSRCSTRPASPCWRAWPPGRPSTR